MMDLKQEILRRVDDDLKRIEKELEKQLNPYLDLVSEIAGHILFSGGKRMRPLLMILSARVCKYQGDYDVTFSTAFEYLHAATLLHDDLVDGATLRRGSPVANSIWGNAITVLVGDFLLARALSVAAGTRNLDVIRVIGEITEQMSQGEIFQLMKKGDLDLSETDYLEIIRSKTAVLFEGACRVSALLAGAPEKEESALARYGHHLGMAFQMADDLFDYIFETGQFGKRVGADLREGKITLPLIVALAEARPEDREKMQEVIRSDSFDETAFGQLVEMLDQYGGLRYTRSQAERHIDEAKSALDVFVPSDSRETLLMLADYVLERKT
jgi:octaprenyl-diphosphate synthase